ncbi:HAMP domain-containing protein [Sphingobacteriales bacterium UPWRP_1]|nr:PAS domain-containing sensor histidine kinase [Sphingobacteriales bacterium TSM_CSS]PSJ73664.1 HAMP domain-containing protein [Sphingobacteriales bacterium UPWRP_1]
MKIKEKLTLWVSFLFLLIIILIVVGIKYINQISNDTQNILENNYNTLDYSRQMLIHLDNMTNSDIAISEFQKFLSLQQNNITEEGEYELTMKLSLNFEKLKSNLSDNSLYISIRSDLSEIMLLNMQAIQRKSEIAKNTARTAILMISITGSFCFFLAFSLLLNLPSSIANPIRELTQSVKEIAAKNYSQRVHFEQHNEFGELAQSFNIMAEKLQEYNNSNLAKLMMEKKLIETLINNMHAPVIGLDENRKILFINNEALTISGLKAEDVIGKQAQEVAVYNDLIRCLIQEVIQAGDIEKQKQPLKIYADNKESFFEKEIIPISIIPTAEKQPKHIGDVIILQNITPFKELDFAKTNFIATVSHELKTPISSILMSLDLLENEQIGTVNSEQKQLIQSVKEDSHRLLKITGELLNMTQVETGKIQLSLQATPLQEIINYAIETIKVQAEQKNITIDIDCPENIPNVHADREKTAWVLTNLLSNAIRYSYEHSNILLTVKEVENRIQLSVKDVGKGIDPKYQHKIFDRYFQIPGSNKSGTGLGLAISKEFIEAQGGKISLFSEIGKGSTFTVTLNKAIS